jgi:hypothetical protein
MAVVSMMRFPGDPEALVASMREHIGEATERLAEKHGGIASIVARDGDAGLLVINLWETVVGRHAMAAEPEILAGLEAAGFPPPNFEGYEVLELRIGDRAAAAAR